MSAMTGAVLIDNHLINDPVLRAYGADGVAPLPDWIWELTDQIAAVTKVAVRRAPATVSHIFTNYISRDEGTRLQPMRELAAERGAQYLPVWLTCPPAELARRVDLPDRHRERVKMRDPAALLKLVAEKGLADPPPDALVLDTSTVSAQEAAHRIVDWSQRVR
jgi:hypothetical protein